MMLKKIRIISAALFFVAVSLLFLDFTGAARAWLGWTANVQFLPALFAANFAVVAALVLLTLLFGRIYCSVVCPLGVLQDIFFKLADRRKRNRMKYSPPKTYLRIGFLALFAAAVAAGFVSAAALIAPYSAYGRIATNLFAPIWAAGNNVLAFFAERAGSYAFYSADVWFKGIGVFAVAVATLAVVGVLAWRGGRTYCNTVCPVGTVLGVFSKFAFFRPVIDTSKCNSCGLCARNCKSQCINSKEHKIDYSRCVDCFDCIGKCRQSAISYSFGYRGKSKSAEKPNADAKKRANAAKFSSESEKSCALSRNGRRGFFAALLTIGGSVAANAEEKINDGGLAPIRKRRRPERHSKIVPAGAVSVKHFSEKCTACQLCVSACPSGVLEPSAKLSDFMQPEMSYERGYCATDCVKCSQVCPAGAILPISVAEKSSVQVGRAVWFSERCIVNTDNMQCDNCFRQCPTAAIAMIAKNPKDPKSPKVPVVDEARCIGCGACENLCPARPVAAICVESNPVHSVI